MTRLRKNPPCSPTRQPVLCEKFRDDAFRVFFSGLRRNLTDVLFAAKPKDMPSALVLAQEVESNHERYTFATSFARSQEDRDRRQYPKVQEQQQDTPGHKPARREMSARKNPHFTKHNRAQVHSAPSSERMARGNAPEPTDVEPSSARMQASHAPAYPKWKQAASGPA